MLQRKEEQRQAMLEKTFSFTIQTQFSYSNLQFGILKYEYMSALGVKSHRTYLTPAAQLPPGPIVMHTGVGSPILTSVDLLVSLGKLQPSQASVVFCAATKGTNNRNESTRRNIFFTNKKEKQQ